MTLSSDLNFDSGFDLNLDSKTSTWWTLTWTWVSTWTGLDLNLNFNCNFDIDLNLDIDLNFDLNESKSEYTRWIECGFECEFEFECECIDFKQRLFEIQIPARIQTCSYSDSNRNKKHPTLSRNLNSNPSRNSLLFHHKISNLSFSPRQASREINKWRKHNHNNNVNDQLQAGMDTYHQLETDTYQAFDLINTLNQFIHHIGILLLSKAASRNTWISEQLGTIIEYRFHDRLTATDIQFLLSILDIQIFDHHHQILN